MGCLWSIVCLSFWLLLALVVGAFFPPGLFLVPIVVVVWAVHQLSVRGRANAREQTDRIVEAIERSRKEQD